MSMPSAGSGSGSSRLRDHGVLVRHCDRPRIGKHLRVTIGTDKEMKI